jgi:hypothetical protein
MLSRSLKVDVSHRQFYLWDPAMPFEPPVDWTNEDVDHGMKEARHLLAIAPPRDGVISVQVEIHQAEAALDLAEWDHAVEGGLEIVSGALELQEWSGLGRWRFKVDPGRYRVRALFGNLESYFREDGPELDHYLLAVWPGQASGVRVFKQFHLELDDG